MRLESVCPFLLFYCRLVLAVGERERNTDFNMLKLIKPVRTVKLQDGRRELFSLPKHLTSLKPSLQTARPCIPPGGHTPCISSGREAMEDGDSKATLELIIDPQNSKVICASAQKGFIDFIFSLLKLPLGTVLKLFSPQSKIGSLGNLYQSVKNLNQVYFITNRAKSSLLSPNVFISDLATPLLLGTTAIKEPTYYLCNSCKGKVTTVRNIICTNCKLEMIDKVDFVVPSASHSSGSRTEDRGESTEGFVRERFYFTITDDLIVTPPCMVTNMKIFENYGIVDGVKYELKKVVVGIKEGLAILEASLESSTVLTDVFCSAPTKKRERFMISQ